MTDVSTQTQLVSMCIHTLFLCARELVCAISLGAHDLELHLANKRATSLPEDGEPEYRLDGRANRDIAFYRQVTRGQDS